MHNAKKNNKEMSIDKFTKIVLLFIFVEVVLLIWNISAFLIDCSEQWLFYSCTQKTIVLRLL